MKTPHIKPPKINIAEEFRQFILRGNVIDMAVGIIIGAAFGKIVSSLVADVLMPPIGVLIGGVDFTQFKLQIASDTYLEYGKFIQTTFDFLITAFAIFLVIKLSNRLRRAHEDKTPEALKPVEVSKEEQLLSIFNNVDNLSVKPTDMGLYLDDAIVFFKEMAILLPIPRLAVITLL